MADLMAYRVAELRMRYCLESLEFITVGLEQCLKGWKALLKQTNVKRIDLSWFDDDASMIECTLKGASI